MSLGERAGRALRQGVVGAVLLVALFVVLTDVLHVALAQEVGAVLFALALPWPVPIGTLFGFSKLSGLSAMVLGLSLNWTLLALLRQRLGKVPQSLFPPPEH